MLRNTLNDGKVVGHTMEEGLSNASSAVKIFKLFANLQSCPSKELSS